ncbi:hypothetical protein INT47_011890 [Mucor saturninus]|uniref:Uncharacterized protein n=1 Tax=Mucor saturninus TaxID=64648 RepID=A0A8H7V5C4_9FUNG|nr:hypothetical protein INT47_011890 [Mucor saturninus]
MTDQLPDFIPIEETPDNIYIDPPLHSDAVDKPYNPHHTTITNLNLFHNKFRFLNILGREIYQSRTGVKKGTLNSKRTQE